MSLKEQMEQLENEIKKAYAEIDIKKKELDVIKVKMLIESEHFDYTIQMRYNEDYKEFDINRAFPKDLAKKLNFAFGDSIDFDDFISRMKFINEDLCLLVKGYYTIDECPENVPRYYAKIKLANGKFEYMSYDHLDQPFK